MLETKDTMATIQSLEEELQMCSYPVKTAVSGRMRDEDAIYLARIGKKQVLKVRNLKRDWRVSIDSVKRNFGFLSMVGLACTLMSTWEAIFVVFALGYANGGPAGLIYGVLFIWAGTLSVFTVMGELVSMIPSAGGQYHWVFLLAPSKCRKILSYTTGWLTCIGWLASAAATSLFCSSMVQGLIIQNSATYTPERWQVTLLFWATMVGAIIFNVVVSAALPKVEGLILVIHIVGFFAILIPLVYLGPRADTKTTFTTFLNLGGWPDQSVSFFIGLAGNCVAFVGADGAVHMCEEIKNARMNVPRAMLTSVFINGALGFEMLLALLYCAGDLEAALTSPTGYPFIAIFTQATNSIGGATAMTAVVVVIAFSATIGTVAAASRQLWAFARDRGVPGWYTLGKIHHKLSVPLAAIIVVTAGPCLLSLNNIWSTTILNDILSLILAGLFSSYFLPAALLLYRRIMGQIQNFDGDSGLSNPREKLMWGPWRLKGVLGIANNIFASAYLAIVVVFSFFPPTKAVTPMTMNYSVLMFGATILFSMVYYFAWAKMFYSGPVVEV